MKFTHALALSGAAVCLTACQFETTSDPSAPIWAREQSIEAIGRASIEVLPNRAEFGVSYRAQAATAAEANALAITRANLAVEAMREIGEDAVRITTSIDVEPFYEQVRIQVSEFEEAVEENIHPNALIGYVAIASVDVESSDLEGVATLRGAALALGPSEAGSVRFFLDAGVELQRTVFAAAVADAQARAEIVAQTSGDQLGSLLVLREGTQSCLGQVYGAPGQDALRSDASDRIVVTGSRIRRTAYEAVSELDLTDSSLATGSISVDDIVEAAEAFTVASDFDPHRMTARVCAIYAVE
ncbi:SIMPL domain-containing protein [Maricaulis sp.]|uniref:SIMPL domain-containing protein n=1 Tax=Maricaulis sp. TaxID=1486257 RepID=UPI001B25D170|nr:SIMPL domain-containing protein [Maricaulis sp.]MBO6796654.1 SIMPL domain-containing protein [Maricaulis sp.]